jgi:hypothetical protein
MTAFQTILQSATKTAKAEDYLSRPASHTFAQQFVDASTPKPFYQNLRLDICESSRSCLISQLIVEVGRRNCGAIERADTQMRSSQNICSQSAGLGVNNDHLRWDRRMPLT